jgi:hypothetical protein
MIQVVQNGRRFAFDRDIIQLFGNICNRAAVKMCSPKESAALNDFLKQNGITDAILLDTCNAMSRFVDISRSPKYEGRNAHGAWHDSGLAALPQAATLCLFFFIGAATTDFYWKYIREALPVNVPTPGGSSMTEMFDRAAHALRAETSSSADRRVAEMNDLKDKEQEGA